ncbi:PH domain-containing protein [Leucobacter komagatae]|uniref:PH domain-containing protein n=1 Tax=Leucobacter komagatae TaxID=55969 RepID=UPI0012EE6A19|nr:PH domain-containing protein [Leucobacter komagatae]
MSRFNRGMSVAICAVLLVFAISTVWLPGGPERFVGLVPLAALAALSYVGLWLPYLRVGDDSITVRNVLRTVTIPWNALVHVDTKYNLTLHVPGRTVNVFVAPAPGTVTAARLARRSKREGRSLDAPRPGDLSGTDSGDAAALVRTRWAELQHSERVAAGVADTTPVISQWNTGTLAVIVGGVVLSAAALLLW